MLRTGGYTLLALALVGIISHAGAIVNDFAGSGWWALVYNLLAGAIGLWMVRRGAPTPPASGSED